MRRYLLLLIIPLITFAIGERPTSAQEDSPLPTPTATATPVTARVIAPQPAPIVVSAPTNPVPGSVLRTGWPFHEPPQGHFNTFMPGAVDLGIFQLLIEPPLFLYDWSQDAWRPMAGRSWEVIDNRIVRVYLPDEATWSDGTAFTTRDVVATFALAEILDGELRRTIESVAVIDDLTIDFVLRGTPDLAVRRILRETPIRPAAAYQPWADEAGRMIVAGAQPTDPEWAEFLTRFSTHRPPELLSLGPYTPTFLTSPPAAAILRHRPASHLAALARIETISILDAPVSEIEQRLLRGELDFAPHAVRPTIEQRLDPFTYGIIRAPFYSGPALYFNHRSDTLGQLAVRQAIAYALDRGENAAVSAGASARPVVYPVGISNFLLPDWLTAEEITALEPYMHDPQRAAGLMASAGYTRTDAGPWVSPLGEALTLDLIAPVQYADWAAAAVNVADQLGRFGIQVRYVGVSLAEYGQRIDLGDFDLALFDWGVADPHPYASYEKALVTRNRAFATADEARPGIGFNLTQFADDLGYIDLRPPLLDLQASGDESVQRAAVRTLATAYNALLPQLPLWERYSNNPVNLTTFTGWPVADAPIHRNGALADPYLITLILDGTLAPLP